MMLAGSLAGCVEESEPEPAAEAPSEEVGACGVDAEAVAVVTKLRFAREEPQGVSVGLDLDGIDSDNRDARGCFQEDMVDAQGNTGIDNQFARLMPSIEAVGGEAIEGLVQGAINSGELLIIVKMAHVDDLEEDSCVDVSLMHGEGSPEVGTRGLIESGQTFDVDHEVPTATIEGVAIEGGVISAGLFEFQLPIQIFEFELELTIRKATARFEIAEDGSLSGFISGAILVQEIVDLSKQVEMGGGEVARLVPVVVKANADLAPNEEGECQEISVAMVFEATPAFLFED